ncbi:MAG TPA: aldo/keto reductase [Mycobacteriales bacterium]|nr:aldo/keto reductase [Mycobacteriales bacterium]
MPLSHRRPLGSSGITVSDLSIGSWLTFEHLPRDTGVAILRRARECGIDFFDDARYDDRTGRAPIRTGYSEVVFGEIFRAAGIARDEVVVANKAWLEFWPDQDIGAEVGGSLGRLGFDYLDLVYCAPPPAGLPVADLVEAFGRLLAAGRVRAWGVLNWTAGQLAEAGRACAGLGVAGPAAAQLPYSLVQRASVENPEVAGVLRAERIGVVASYVLAGGALTGKYSGGGAVGGRIAARVDDPGVRAALDAGAALGDLGARIGADPAALAIAFVLANPDVCSALLGATSPAQVTANTRAHQVLSTLDDDTLAALRRIGAPG